MRQQIKSLFGKLELIETGPLTFSICFDKRGKGFFDDRYAVNVQMAARHAVGDLCEIKDGYRYPLTVVEESNSLVISLQTYDIFNERLEIKASECKPQIEILYRLEFLKSFEAHEVGTLLFKPVCVPQQPVVYIAGRQGVCPNQETVRHEVLVDEEVPISGWMFKNNPTQSIWVTSDESVKAIADWTRDEDGTWVGLTASVVPEWQYVNYPATRSAWPELLKYEAGTSISYKARISNGRLSDADTKGLLISGMTDYLQDEQEFIYAVSILGTFRPYTKSGRWFNRTAIAVHHPLARYYDWSWMRDNAHGYYGAALTAGSVVHKAFADEIDSWLKAPKNQYGVWPHNNGLAFYEQGALWEKAWASNLDTPAQLIEMIYLYASQTGDFEFIKRREPEIRCTADAMMDIVRRNPYKRSLPWIDERGDTYMDLGFIRGEQTYLTAVFYRGFKILACIMQLLEDTDSAGCYEAIADKMKACANLPFQDGGLWDEDEQCYIGWRDLEGCKQPEGGHESYGNLVAIGCGLCRDETRASEIFRWLNRNWKVLYEKNGCPMTHANVPYSNWEGGLIHDGLTHSVPWICGWDIKGRYTYDDGQKVKVWELFLKNYYETDYPYVEGADGAITPYRSNRGRIWDSWGLLMAIWNIHLGIEPKPGHIEIHPSFLEREAPVCNAVYCWQQRLYHIHVKMDEKSTSQIIIDGKEWPSRILPAFGCNLDVMVGIDPDYPVLTGMDHMTSIDCIEWDNLVMEISGRIVSRVRGKKYMEFFIPAGMSITEVSMEDTRSMPVVVENKVEFRLFEESAVFRIHFHSRHIPSF